MSETRGFRLEDVFAICSWDAEAQLANMSEAQRGFFQSQIETNIGTLCIESLIPDSPVNITSFSPEGEPIFTPSTIKAVGGTFVEVNYEPGDVNPSRIYDSFTGVSERGPLLGGWLTPVAQEPLQPQA